MARIDGLWAAVSYRKNNLHILVLKSSIYIRSDKSQSAAYQNAECRMQNAKCKMQTHLAFGSHVCSHVCCHVEAKNGGGQDLGRVEASQQA